jgi:hypothetical protein
MTAITTQDELKTICQREAQQWIACVDPFSERPRAQKFVVGVHCTAEREQFDTCVGAWREAINDKSDPPRVRIRGDRPGLPPPQCAELSCQMAKCMSASQFSHEVCSPYLQNFKHCCLKLYGCEYMA